MITSGSSEMGALSLVEPHQVHGSIGPASPETLGPRVLELSSLLQTTLDIERQISLFASSIKKHLKTDGLIYSGPHDEKYTVGDTTSPRATYDLKLENESLGSVKFFREVPFTTKEIKLLENLLCGLVYPLRNSLTYLTAMQLASHDPLTGVQNRLAMDNAMNREVDLAHRQGSSLSMMMLDADKFKRFNDKYGHSFGDEVLKAIANSASATVRSSDLLFRYGGEEFVILAAHTDKDGALLLAERIRQSIAHISTIQDTPVQLSVSIGVSTLAEGETVKELFDRTDEAMFEAKEAGRNRVVMS